MKKTIFGGIALGIALAGPCRAQPQDVKLVLMIVVDQLRGDVPEMFEERWASDGGFRYLLDHGTYYTNTHYTFSTTFTSAGHATLATGVPPQQHGIVGNDWTDVRSGQRVYSCQDDRHRIVGQYGPQDSESLRIGTSPNNLLATTLADRIVTSNSSARAFGVSLKDRGAILPAGKNGKAFWYSKKTGMFVTSTYYYEALPPWAFDWNERLLADQWAERGWELSRPREEYRAGAWDDRPQERSVGNFGRTFPHAFPPVPGPEHYNYVRHSPVADELTLSFTEALLRNENVGRGDALDFLSVSFSATDYVGHAFGPHSLEAEDNYYRLDATLGRLLRLVDELVGLDKTLVALSSDHGTDATPEFRAHQCGKDERHPAFDEDGPYFYGWDRFCGVGRLKPEDLRVAANDHLAHEFGAENLVKSFWNPTFFFDLPIVLENKLNLVELEVALAEFLQGQPGIAVAVPRTELMTRPVPSAERAARMREGLGDGAPTSPDELWALLMRAIHPMRSGHVVIVQEPYWFLYHNPNEDSAMHGSPYTYDTHVPLFFAGPGFDNARSEEPRAPSDLVWGLAEKLNLKPTN